MINKEVANFLEQRFQPVLHNCMHFCYMTRGREFQVESVAKLETLKAELLDIKRRMIDERNEDAANCCLSLEQVASAVQHELNMWIAFKDDRADKAWDEFVNCEMSVHTALQAHEIANDIHDYLPRLSAMEQILFPHIQFMSIGFIIHKSHCSICKSDYGTCDHLKGIAYMGEMCARVITEGQLIETSLVQRPANKHARLTSMTIDGEMRDLLTWRIAPDEHNDNVTNLPKEE